MLKKYFQLIFLLIVIHHLAYAQSVIRGPYLQKVTPNSIVVKWRTDLNVNSVIEYSTNQQFDTFTVLDTNIQKTDHEIEITGLTPYTVYYYRIGNGGSLINNSTDLYFRTSPTIGEVNPYSFWVLGRVGNANLNNINALNVRDEYYNYIDEGLTDGIIFTGDNSNIGTDSGYQTSVFDMYGSKLANSVLWSCFGNLDAESATSSNQSGVYYDIFTFPKSGESGGLASNTEAYFSFDYGNIHFMVLNSHDEDRSVGETMYNWALSDIQNTSQDWIIAIWHHPPYSGGWHPSEGLDIYGNPSEINLTEMRENFVPMLESNGVDMVITGHSESYERSFFINGHYGLSASFDLKEHSVGPTGAGDGKVSGNGVYSKSKIGDKAGLGTVYTVVANSASSVTKLFNHNSTFYSPDYQQGSGILEINNKNLTFKYLNKNGVIEDSFTIHKGPDYIFDGTWQNGNNPDGVSSNMEDIAIVSGNTSISSNTVANTLVVSPGAKVSLDAGVDLTINRIQLESESDNYAVLNPEETSNINGSAIYKRFTNQIGSGSSGGNDLISSPLTNGTMETFGDFAIWNKNLASSGDIRAFGLFNNESGNYENFNIVANENTALEPGRGYRAATLDGSPLEFRGNINISNVNPTITIGSSSIWNLVGNPYTSYVDSQAFITENGSLGNNVLDTSFNAIYGYNAGTDGSGIWTVINNVQNISKNIAPGQGFFVASNGVGGSNNLSFTPSMRTNNGNDDFILGRTEIENSISHLKVGIDNTNKSYFTDFYFTENSTLGLDPGFDAGSIDATFANFSLYSRLVEDNNDIDMAIQALSVNHLNDVTIPLGINAPSGLPVVFSIIENDLPTEIQVYLEDNITNSMVLLNANEYSFTPTENVNGTGRFFLHLTSQVLSDNEALLNGLHIYTTSSPKKLNIEGLLAEQTTLEIYDLHGRLMLTSQLNDRFFNSIELDFLSKGVYIIKLQLGEFIKTQKVIVN
ncbi:fibronectin type III domain-containing protein [Winogradskyella poriferorum]|uniref:fibronectin type III domain-containing protein n=1 Tax=Winogradskyella poriferorum TaxID=307627 RepID=UPI003D654AC2